MCIDLQTQWPTLADPVAEKWIKIGAIGGFEHHVMQLVLTWSCLAAKIMFFPNPVNPSSHARWSDPQVDLLGDLVRIGALFVQQSYIYVTSYVKHTSVNS